MLLYSSLDIVHMMSNKKIIQQIESEVYPSDWTVKEDDDRKHGVNHISISSPKGYSYAHLLL